MEGCAMSTAQPLLVRKIEQVDRLTFTIEWTDGHLGRWSLPDLRRECPCAACIDEWTGEPLLDPRSVSDDLLCSSIQSVGRYALAIKFSDGHHSGIYPFTRLRELCQCKACAKK
jgi:DUF971 family protein